MGFGFGFVVRVRPVALCAVEWSRQGATLGLFSRALSSAVDSLWWVMVVLRGCLRGVLGLVVGVVVVVRGRAARPGRAGVRRFVLGLQLQLVAGRAAPGRTTAADPWWLSAAVVVLLVVGLADYVSCRPPDC